MIVAVFLLAVLAAACEAAFDISSATASRVLVIVDALDIKRTHAAYFKDLAGALMSSFCVCNASHSHAFHYSARLRLDFQGRQRRVARALLLWRVCL